MHTFKPYADDPTVCVAELPCGDTCNQPIEYHDPEGEWCYGDCPTSDGCPRCK